MTADQPISIPFMKMHGLGNDFVVLDARTGAIHVAEVDALAAAMADRHRGIGFDQLAVIDEGSGQDISLTFWNADGSRSAACGNATRCIAAWEMARRRTDALSIDTQGRTLQARADGNGLTSVNMGHALTDWQDIPLAEASDTLHLPIEGDPVATGMGNPHCTFFVEDAEAIDLAARGPEMEHHPLFPERTNVQFASLIAANHLRMRVWERGTGITLASGSSSCAVASAAHRRGLTGSDVKITLDGGDIHLSIAEDGIWMTGPTAHVFDGIWHG